MPDLVLKLKCCPVCLTARDLIPNVRFYGCGHPICIECYNGLPPHNRSCPGCRHAQQEPPQSIFLSPDDLLVGAPGVGEETNPLIDGLNKLNSDSPLISVERAIHKLEKEKKRKTIDPDLLNYAIQNLQQRLAPAAEQLTRLREQIATLQDEVQRLDTSKKKYKERVLHVEATIKAEREERERQRRRADVYRSTVQQRDTEFATLVQQREERDKQIHLLKTKLRALAKTQKRKSPHRGDLDMSLQIENEPHAHRKDEPTQRRNLGTDLQTHRTKRRKEISD